MVHQILSALTGGSIGRTFTAVFRKVPEGYVTFVEEFAGANTQGATLDEARANLQEAVASVLESRRGPRRRRVERRGGHSRVV